MAKPVVPSELFDVLSKHISDVERVYNSKDNVSIQPALSEQVFDNAMPSIDTMDGLMRVTGNKELYLRLLIVFYENNKDLSQTIRSHISQGHLDEASQMLHSIKGVAGNLGAKILKDATRILEYAVKDGVFY